MRDVSVLRARLATLSREAFAARAAVEVVRREWYTGLPFDMRPLYFERFGWPPARRLAQRPAPDEDCHEIGFDAAGRPAALTYHHSGQPYYERFWDYSGWPDTVEEVTFFAGGRPTHLLRCTYSDGRMRVAQEVPAGSHGDGYEEYEYSGDAVTRVRFVGEFKSTFNAAYDDRGHLSRLEQVFGGGSTELIYERPPADFSVERACEVVRHELVRQVPVAVRGLGVEQPARFVALDYLPDDPLEVTVRVGEDGDFEAEPDMSAVAGTLRMLRQELTLSQNQQRAARLLGEVAAELNSFAWQDILPIGPEFTVLTGARE